MRIASYILSYIFHPMLLPTAFILVIFGLNPYIANTTPFNKQLFLAAWVFVNSALIPFLFTAFLRWKNMIQSIHLDQQKDRILPFAFTLFLYITNYWLLRDIPMPNVIYSLLIGSTIAVGMALMVNFFSKISIHMIGMGGFTAAIYGMAQLYELELSAFIVITILASGLVGSARYFLESHNLRQIYLGWLTGFAAVYVPTSFGWG